MQYCKFGAGGYYQQISGMRSCKTFAQVESILQSLTSFSQSYCFRSLHNPSMSVSNSKELSLYCDILEMDTAICKLLIKLATVSSFCLGTIVHTYDRLSVLITLLNRKNFREYKNFVFSKF